MRATLLLVIAAALCAPACGWLATEQVTGRAQRGALLRAQDALARRNYALAIEHADRALRFGSPPPDTEAELALLKADALDGLGRHGEAAQLYRYVGAIHAGSPYGSRAAAQLEDLAARGIDVAPTSSQAGPTSPLTSLQMSRLVVEREWLEEPVEIFYPYQAEAEGLEGFVLVRLSSDPAGRLATWEVQASSHPVFEAAVVNSLPRFRFVPEEMAEGESPNTRIVRFTFRLRGSRVTEEPGG